MNRVENNFQRSVLGFLHDIATSWELKIRIWLIFVIASFIFVPDLFVLILLLEDVFSDAPVTDPTTVVFKAIIIAIVFLFGVIVVAAASHNQYRLKYSLPAIGLGLVLVAVWLMGKASNSCIPDMACSRSKFLIVIAVVTVLSAFAFPLTKPKQKSSAILAIPYLMIAFWQALLLMFVIITADQIQADHNYVQMLILFAYSVFWVFIFMIGSQENKDPFEY